MMWSLGLLVVQRWRDDVIKRSETIAGGVRDGVSSPCLLYVCLDGYAALESVNSVIMNRFSTKME